MLASMGGLGACAPPPPPRTFSNLKALKRHFQHSQANSCVKKVPKIDRYFLSFDKIRDSQVKLGQSRLIRDRGWTLCKGFWGVRGACSSGKNRNLRSSNCWKCIETVNPTITTLFLYRSFNLLRSHLADLFGSWGVRAHPAHHPCLRA